MDAVAAPRPLFTRPIAAPSVQGATAPMDRFTASDPHAYQDPTAALRAMQRDQATISGISRNQNGEQRNHQITAEYHDLSDRMGKMLGGRVNWATVAQHASSEAGRAIRQEQVPTGTHTLFNLARVGVGLSTFGLNVPSNPLDDSSATVAAGNKRVFDDIAPHYARFIDTFQGDTKPDPAKLAAFDKGFGPGDRMLRDAFHNYYNAMFEPDKDKGDQQVLLGNLQMALHEQRRLQPYIQGAVPYGAREFSTSHFLSLHMPNNETLSVGSDLAPRADGSSYPANMRNITNPELRAFLDRWQGNSLNGSHANDWTELPDRMRYISNLFRQRADQQSLFQSPE